MSVMGQDTDLDLRNANAYEIHGDRVVDDTLRHIQIMCNLGARRRGRRRREAVVALTPLRCASQALEHPRMCRRTNTRCSAHSASSLNLQLDTRIANEARVGVKSGTRSY
jgi:hypothetical protein